MVSTMLSKSGLPIKVMIREASTLCLKKNIFEMAGSRNMESRPI